MKKILFFLFGILLFTNQIHAQFTLTDSLKAYYPFNNNANDESGNGNDGTVNGASITTNRFGNTDGAYLFDGVDDYIKVPYDPSLYPSSITVSFWIKKDTVNRTQPEVLISNRGSGTDPPYDPLWFAAPEDSSNIQLDINGDNDSKLISLFTDTSVDTINWYYICGYYDEISGEAALFLNGQKEDSSILAMELSSNDLGMIIGTGQTTSGGPTWTYYMGCIDDIRIYSRALSESEISQLYANYYPPDTLIAEPGDKQVILSWDTTNWEYLDKVYIYRDLALHDSVNITLITDTSYTDLNLINYQEYSYFIQSKDDWGNMSISSDTITTFPCEIVTDWDGNSYKTTKIGNQVWMAENMNATHYADGTPIPLVEDGTAWDNLAFTDKAYCYYDNNISNGDVYGALYTWPAAMNGEASSNSFLSGVQGVCPDGWNFPGDTAWKELEIFLGMSEADANIIGWRGTNEGGKLKEAGITHWNSPNTGANNSSSFTALPGGFRGTIFGNIGKNAYFWSSTEGSSATAWYRALAYGDSEVGRSGDYSKKQGFSVRCVKSVPISGTYSIGPSSSDFLNFTEAVNSLKNTEIDGPVVFNVESGTYTEQVSIPEITGASEINTITFQSETGDSTDVILTYSADSTNHYTLQLNGADYITVKNLTLSSLYEDNPRIIDFTGNATHNTFDNNVFSGAGINGNKYYKAYLRSKGPGNSYNIISENLFLGGVAAIHFDQNSGNTISKNIFENQVISGILLQSEDSCYVGKNIIKSNAIDYSLGILINYCDDSVRVVKNRIELSSVVSEGISINQSNGSATARNLIANNFISVGNNGISCSTSSNIDIYFNNILVHGSTRTNSKAIDIPYYSVPFSSLNVFNNNLINFAQGYAISIDNLSGVTCDYNNFFTTGSNLGYYNSTDITDITAYQVTTGQEANSISIDPEYLSDSDLHIENVSLKAGTPLSEVTDDIDEDARDIVTPFIGADELTELQMDSLALIALYDSTDGANWTNSTNWLTGSVSAWYGITVSGNRITEIDLNSNNLVGTIPFEIGNLTNLLLLELYGNQLSGTIPPEISNLMNLTGLYLSNNQFTDLPNLVSFGFLNYLEIQNNQFTFKDIEPNIGIASTTFTYSPQDSVGEIIDTTVITGTNLTLVVTTGGANNQYQWKKDGTNIGTVSGDSTFTLNPIAFSDSGAYTCEITNTVATDLTLYSHPVNVSVEYPLFYQDSLALVALYNSTNGTSWINSTNWLTGNVSTWYGITVSNDRVTEININSNNLTGSIPPDIGNLSNLQGLILPDNQLSGIIPVEIGNLTGLRSLELRNNTISGTIPREISNLIYLVHLWLQCNQLSGAVPVEIWNLINIRNLQLFDNQLSGTIPTEIWNLSNLVFLNLQNNQFTGLANLSPLGSLAELTIGNNRFTFKDIEPNIGVPNTTYTYSPQDSVGQPINTTVYVGTSYTISVSTGGTNSLYQWKKDGVSIGSISSDSTFTINPVAFSDSGTYTCEITNTVATDLTLYSRPIHVRATIISSFPYSEDFESGNGGWRAGGINSSWQLGDPTGSTINTASSDSTAWVTNLAGDYNLNEISYVTSPRFDLSGINYPKIEFSIWWDAEGFYDGANCQYKQGTGEWKTLGIDEGDESWYNSSYIYSIEKGFGFDLNNSSGWTGDNEWGYGSDGWVTVDHALTGIDDLSEVRFRIAFASNSSYQNDGIAIDNITIFDDPTGIDAVNGLLSDIQIYPNPNEGTFKLVYNGEQDVDMKLQLVNLQGQVILTEQIKAGNRFNKEFMLNYLLPGIYYFRLINNEEVVVKKMVIE